VGALFFKVLEMSFMGSVVILITILARFLLRKRSKNFIMILWAVVALRLVVPFGIESAFSIFNYLPVPAQTVPVAEQVSEAVLPDNYVVPEATFNAAEIVDMETKGGEVSVSPSNNGTAARSLPDIKIIIAAIWLAGTAGVISYCSIRYIGLKRKLKTAKRIDKNIYESDKIKSPFVFGFFVPKMYLPDSLDEAEREYVLIHERTHIKHGDWIKKFLGIAVLSVHWFNPLVWLAFALFEQDIEMSCDETTISALDAGMRKAYAISLVSYAKISSNKNYLVTPLGFSKNAFGKAEVTNRVMNIVNFKKGSKVTSVVIAAAILVLAAACSFNSKPSEDTTETSLTSLSSETTEETAFEIPVEKAISKNVIDNEHKFENGVCKDCGMLWTEYFFECLQKLDMYHVEGGWYSIYGAESAARIHESDYVQFITSDKNVGEIYYQHLDDDFNKESCSISIQDIGDGKSIAVIEFDLSQGMINLGDGIHTYKYQYSLIINADPGDYDKVFKSKESFAEYCTPYLFVLGEDNVGTDVWSTKSEAEIKQMFDGSDGSRYYSKEELVDIFWKDYSRMFASVDYGLTQMNTSLADTGINWK